MFLVKFLLKTKTLVLSRLTLRPHSLQKFSRHLRAFSRPTFVSERTTRSSAQSVLHQRLGGLFKEILCQPLFYERHLIFFAKSTHNRSLVMKKILVGHSEWCVPKPTSSQKQAENGFFDFSEHKFNFLENRQRQKNERPQFLFRIEW